MTEEHIKILQHVAQVVSAEFMYKYSRLLKRLNIEYDDLYNQAYAREMKYYPRWVPEKSQLQTYMNRHASGGLKDYLRQYLHRNQAVCRGTTQRPLNFYLPIQLESISNHSLGRVTSMVTTPDLMTPILLEQMRKCIDKLPEPQRHIIRAQYIDEIPQNDIARQYKRDISWVSRQSVEGIIKLRKMMVQ